MSGAADAAAPRRPLRSASVELFHMYGIWTADVARHAAQARDRGDDPEGAVVDDVRGIAKRCARLSAAWLGPYLERLGTRASTCILIDDYFRVQNELLDGLKWTTVAAEVVSAYQAEGIEVDFVASEAGIAASVSELLDRLVPTPDPGAGSVAGAGTEAKGAGSLWINNLEPKPPSAPSAWAARSSGGAPPPARVSSAALSVTRQHSLRVDVEVARRAEPANGRDQPYSCPLLAAWWQLLRLGVVGDVGADKEFAHAIARFSDRDRSFRADASLSLLPATVLDVEAAVRLILQHVVRPPVGWDGAVHDGDAVGFHDSVLRRIAYVFVDDYNTLEF